MQILHMLWFALSAGSVGLERTHGLRVVTFASFVCNELCFCELLWKEWSHFLFVTSFRDRKWSAGPALRDFSWAVSEGFARFGSRFAPYDSAYLGRVLGRLWGGSRRDFAIFGQHLFCSI